MSIDYDFYTTMSNASDPDQKELPELYQTDDFANQNAGSYTVPGFPTLPQYQSSTDSNKKYFILKNITKHPNYWKACKDPDHPLCYVNQQIEQKITQHADKQITIFFMNVELNAFVGVAEKKSPTVPKNTIPDWIINKYEINDETFPLAFPIEWILKTNLSFQKVKEIKNPLNKDNYGTPQRINMAHECQEVDETAALELINVYKESGSSNVPQNIHPTHFNSAHHPMPMPVVVPYPHTFVPPQWIPYPSYMIPSPVPYPGPYVSNDTEAQRKKMIDDYNKRAKEKMEQEKKNKDDTKQSEEGVENKRERKKSREDEKNRKSHKKNRRKEKNRDKDDSRDTSRSRSRDKDRKRRHQNDLLCNEDELASYKSENQDL